MAKFFKWLFIAVTSFLLLFFIVTALLSDRYSVERSINIAAPADSVYKTVVNLDTWKNWNPWQLIDTTMQNNINVLPDYVGSTWEWKSQHLGSGKLEIVESVNDKTMRAKMVFFFPKKSTIDEFWTFDQFSPDSTKVTWRHDGDLEYPVGRLMGLFSDNLLGPTFEDGLKNLKKFIEDDIPAKNTAERLKAMKK
jgi:hypothetical protein